MSGFDGLPDIRDPSARARILKKNPKKIVVFVDEFFNISLDNVEPERPGPGFNHCDSLGVAVVGYKKLVRF